MKTILSFTILCLLFASSVIADAQSDETSKALNSDGKNHKIKTAELAKTVQVHQLDTLSLNLESAAHYMVSQVRYEATRLIPTKPCTLKYLIFRFLNDIYEDVSKDIEIWLWHDQAGKPGQPFENYWTTTIEMGVEDLYNDVIVNLSDEQIVFDQAFWIGHRELTDGFPTSVVDSVVTRGRN